MIALYRFDIQTHQGTWQEVTALPITEAAQVPENEIWWIDLDQPTEAEEHLVLQSFLQIHLLTLEDVTRPRREPDRRPHFPKAEEFSDYLFVIANPLRPELLAHNSNHVHSRHSTIYTQLSALLTERILITHHYDDLSGIRTVKEFATRHSTCGERGPDYIFHLILDAMVDEYAPLVDLISDSLDTIETHLFRRPPEGLLGKMLRLKRRIVALRKTLILEREVLMRLTRREFALIGERELVYYRNVYDHLIRYTELIEGAREMVSDLLQTYTAALSNRLNAIMKVLAMISTIILPMSLIAGVYGMNFHVMPELGWDYGYPFALGLMGLTALTSIGFFYWKKWI